MLQLEPIERMKMKVKWKYTHSLVQVLSVNDYSDQNVVQKFPIPGVANSISWHDDKMVRENHHTHTLSS
jgi:hypothetical protein